MAPGGSSKVAPGRPFPGPGKVPGERADRGDELEGRCAAPP